MVKSDVFFQRRSGSRRLQNSHHSVEIGLAKRLERRLVSSSMVTKYFLNSDHQPVSQCSQSIKTTSTCKDTLFGLHGTKMGRSTACTSECHECATCRSCA